MVPVAWDIYNTDQRIPDVGLQCGGVSLGVQRQLSTQPHLTGEQTTSNPQRET